MVWCSSHLCNDLSSFAAYAGDLTVALCCGTLFWHSRRLVKRIIAIVSGRGPLAWRYTCALLCSVIIGGDAFVFGRSNASSLSSIIIVVDFRASDAAITC